MPDSHQSIWDAEPDEPATGSRWARPLQALHRLSEALHRARPAEQTPHERSSGEVTTQPLGGRGHALREAHRALRRQLRRHRALQSLLPHLCYIEQALGRQGSAALVEMPLRVLQRGLQQLDRMPWEPHPEPALDPLNTLRLRLIEAIEIRRLHDEVRHPETADVPGDSFIGSADSLLSTQGPDSLSPGGVVVDDPPDSAFDGPHRPTGQHNTPPGQTGSRRR